MPLDLEAIDFQKLRTEERKKKDLKTKKGADDGTITTPQEEIDVAEVLASSKTETRNRHAQTTHPTTSSYKFAALKMTDAIDFKQLMLEERRKAKQKAAAKKASDPDRTTSDIQHTTATTSKQQLPEWPHPPGFLTMHSLNLAQICDNPATISYSPTTFPEETSQMALQQWLQRLPSGDSGLGEWKTMNFGKRRVCMFGEVMGNDNLTVAAPLPAPLQELAQELVTRGIFPATVPPNHVLLNEYQPGQGIMPHTDGPMYESRTATLSLTSSVVMEFTKRRKGDDTNCDSEGEAPPLQVLLEPGSLLVFSDDAYIDHCHGIAMDVWQDVVPTRHRLLNADIIATIGKSDKGDIVVPRELRYSLTFRHKKWE